MVMKDFLRAVLPERGYYYAARKLPDPDNPKNPKGWKWKNYACNDLDDLAIQLKQIGNDKVDAYYAPAAYKEPVYFDEAAGYKRNRTQVNARVVKSAWVDLDCGADKAESGKGYASQEDAVDALEQFLEYSGLPSPTFVINSGNGIHVYWVFTQEVPAELWTKVARQFKAVARHLRFHADPGPTANSAVVLRPVGSYNVKDRENPKEVKVLREGATIGFKGWAKRVLHLVDELGVEVYQGQKPERRSKNAALSGGEPEHKPSDANKVADQCPTIGAMRESQGLDQDNNLWYSCLGVLGFTEQGDEVCHEWSQAHPGYNAEECQAEVERRRTSAGPTTCAFMREQPGALCEGCAHKVTSPIVLGHPDAEHAREETVEVEETGEVIHDEIPPMPRGMEKDYCFDPGRGGLFVWATNKEGVEYQKLICTSYPTIEFLYLDSADKEHYARLRTRTRPGVWEECDIKAAALGRGGAALADALGGKAGIVAIDQKGVENYMQTWFDKTRGDQALQIMRRHMGWQPDDGAFVLGSKAYMPDGSVKSCTLSKELVRFADAHVTQGSKAEQIRLIDEIYNRPFHEHFQFVFAASLGSVLLPLIHDGYIGVPISLWEPDGGQGKTTGCTAAIALWGDYKGHGQIAHANKITEYATYVIAGIRRHLPVLIDETTNWGGERVAKFAYDYSDGISKIQGRAEGGIRDNSDQNWQNFLFLTGNASIITKMEAEIQGAGPQVARVFEIEVPSDKHKKDKKLDEKNREKIQELFRHYGHIGPAFVHAVVQRKEQVRGLTNNIYNQLQREVDSSTDARFWLHTAACVIAANRIATKMGLFKWDADHLEEYVRSKLRELRGISNDMEIDPNEKLQMLFNDVRSGLLVTDIWGGYKTVAMIDQHFPPPRNQEFTGRYLTKTHELFIPVKTVKQWCSVRNSPYKALLSLFKKEGWLVAHDAKKSLTVGTKLGKVGQARCWHLKLTQLAPLTEGDEQQENDDE